MKICTYLAWQSTKFLAAHATELFQRSATSLNRQHLQFSNFFEGEENIKALFKKGVFLNKGGNNGGSKGDHKINSARSVLALTNIVLRSNLWYNLRKNTQSAYKILTT